ncbi:hypothetical protein MKW98_015708 [Papaver atlanticum]|uniref:30S ribosomal protein 3, chloroplastic n=1 Tax=Papaver atlanticum TaxID=357466 RepID=A0AAD4XG80_9MAGN|nr:hypothetical protein MKW98_015708 [Papaver atlanticum]
MLSMAVQASINTSVVTHSSLPLQKPLFKPFKSSISIGPKITSFDFSSLKLDVSRETKFSASASEAIVEEEASSTEEEEEVPEDTDDESQKLGVVVKAFEKPRLVLKFVWLEKNIGLALDQVIPGHGTIPLSPYYFWPRKDAWEELKSMLESKPWISQKRMIILLNQATDIINLWQQSGGNLS